MSSYEQVTPTASTSSNADSDGITSKHPHQHPDADHSISSLYQPSPAPLLAATAAASELILDDTFYRDAIERYQRDREDAESFATMRMAVAVKRQKDQQQKLKVASSITKISVKGGDTSSSKDGGDVVNVIGSSVASSDAGMSEGMPDCHVINHNQHSSTSRIHCELMEIRSERDHGPIALQTYSLSQHSYPKTSPNEGPRSDHDGTRVNIDANVPIAGPIKTTGAAKENVSSETEEDETEAAATPSEKFGRSPAQKIASRKRSQEAISSPSRFSNTFLTTTSSSATESNDGGTATISSTNADGLTTTILKKRCIKTENTTGGVLIGHSSNVIPIGSYSTSSPMKKGAPNIDRSGKETSVSPYHTTPDDKTSELEKKRLASRTSSRRTREREKMKLEYCQSIEKTLQWKNKNLRFENEFIRNLIAKTRDEVMSSSRRASLRDSATVVAAVESTTPVQEPRCFNINAFPDKPNIPTGSDSFLNVAALAAGLAHESSARTNNMPCFPLSTTLPMTVCPSMGGKRPPHPQQSSSHDPLDLLLLRQLISGLRTNLSNSSSSGTTSLNPGTKSLLLSGLESETNGNQGSNRASLNTMELQQLLQLTMTQHHRHEPQLPSPSQENHLQHLFYFLMNSQDRNEENRGQKRNQGTLHHPQETSDRLQQQLALRFGTQGTGVGPTQSQCGQPLTHTGRSPSAETNQKLIQELAAMMKSARESNAGTPRPMDQISQATISELYFKEYQQEMRRVLLMLRSQDGKRVDQPDQLLGSGFPDVSRSSTSTAMERTQAQLEQRSTPCILEQLSAQLLRSPIQASLFAAIPDSQTYPRFPNQS